MTDRRIGLFTIASKNYLAYVRTLFKSVAAVHPEYSLYCCLADEIEGSFDPEKEHFRIVTSDMLDIPCFEDMSIRYDIMEFNTSVKPFMFRWLLQNTDLDCIIYLDPDVQVFSRFDHLESVLAGDTSVVLTPHITRPLEDGCNPNDYHMLQSGVFNLGFAAINRCDEARGFVEWWGRRLETQGDADFSRNLFTDQRWCDLAPCFLDGLRILKDPGYNVAYWNLAEREIQVVDGQWRVNGRPLVFFHFSGVNAGNQNVISKHQNRFDWADIPAVKPLFDAYWATLESEDWETTKHWPYAYSRTRQGLALSPVIRRLYREVFPTSQDFAGSTATQVIIRLCNANADVSALPTRVVAPITRLMDAIYRQRPDMQATFNLATHHGRRDFGRWFASTGAVEYKLAPELVPPAASADQSPQPGDAAKSVAPRVKPIPPPISLDINATVAMGRVWSGLSDALKRMVAPHVQRMLLDNPEDRPVPYGDIAAASGVNAGGGGTGRIDRLFERASVPRFFGHQANITVIMHMIWSSRPDLQAAFNLTTADGQCAFVDWYRVSAKREYGIDVGEFGGVPAARLTPVPAKSEIRPGANLIGYVHAQLGMGEHVRMSAAAMSGTNVNFGVVNFNVGVASGQGAELDHGELLGSNPYAANVFHINADQMLHAYLHLGRDFFINRYNIGYWAWELAKCPPEWLDALKIVDEVWAPSRFIQRAFAEVADVPVEYMPLCVTLPEFSRLDRSHFGLPRQAFIFLYAFDFFSFPDRKNPFAAIRAFKLAFQDNNLDVCLVLKVMNGKHDAPAWLRMMEMIDGDPRIVVINSTLGRGEVLALIETCDCFVSLHRSEGFGRGPAEAMYLGKPVIATNYSGNTDFTLPDNSCLVDYSLIPVAEGQYPLCAGQEWADADIDHAAWYMKKLHGDRSYARELGARGRAFIYENYNERVIGAMYEARLRKLNLA